MKPPMNPDQAKPTNRPDQDETAYVGELQRFSDAPGGALLDDPEVRARERHGRPADRRAAPSDQKEIPPAA